MKIIDDKGKLFGLINITDLLAIVLILAVMGRFYLKAHQNPPGLETKKIEVQVLLEEIRDATADVIEVGDIVRETKSNVVLGEVTNIDIKPSATLVETSDGRVVEYPNPVLKDAVITIVGEGTASENAIVVGNSEIRIGTKLGMKTNIYAVTGTVMTIKVL